MSERALEVILQKKGNEFYVSSRVIANELGKRHSDVLRDIDNIFTNMYQVESIDEAFKNKKTQICVFLKQSEYKVKGQTRKYKEYLLSDEGFILYINNIQGYYDFKITYHRAFKRMRQLLENRNYTEWALTREEGKVVRREFTDGIQKLSELAYIQGSSDVNYYMIYSKLVNDLLKIKSSQRDFLDIYSLNIIRQLEDMFNSLILEEVEKRTYYKEIYQMCKERGQQLLDLIKYNKNLLPEGVATIE